MALRLEHLPADVFALSALARDAQSGRAGKTGLVLPRKVSELPVYTERFLPEERETLARTLEAALAPCRPHVAVLDRVRSLRTPGACAVVTGQQPGFLASPLLSLYKALQAIRLAEQLTQAWERPVVPIFWNHADDHDVAEVHHTHVLNVNLDLQKIALAGLSSGRVPLSQVLLEEEAQRLPTLRALLAQIHETSSGLERALTLFFPRSGETLASAFTRTLLELCGPLGLVVVEPDWIRPELSRELARLVTLDPEAALRSNAARLAEAGYAEAIEAADAALLFRHDRSGPRVQRRALRAGGDGFRYDGEDGSRTAVELAAEITDAPLDWSPGALLRPILQDLCLPVAAYIGGFGELAYHAQLPALRERAGAPNTPFVPRVSLTLVDPECAAALEILGIDVATVLRAKGEYRSTDAGPAEPAVLRVLEEIAERAAQELSQHRDEIAALDPSLHVQLKRTADAVKEAVDTLVAKARRVHQNRSGKGRRHERRVNNTLMPRGEAQERLLGPFPFVARFGESWIRTLAAELDPFAPEHVVVYLEDERRGPNPARGETAGGST